MFLLPQGCGIVDAVAAARQKSGFRKGEPFRGSG